MRRPRRGPALLLGLLLAGTAQSEHLPRWEAGAGLFLSHLPDYPGADESRGRWLPYPYLVYRGDRIRVDDEGIRGRLIEHAQWRLEFSAAGSLALNSEDNSARAGMPDLDYLFELGPSLRWRFRPAPQAVGRWRLDLPLRAVFGTDLESVAHRGWVFEPTLSYGRPLELGGTRPSRLRFGGGPVFADARLHDYIHGVDPAFATLQRPAYEADAGYGGSRLFVSLGHDLQQDLLFGAFVRYDDLQGAVFDDGPLFREARNWTLGVALTWTFARSTERVLHDPDEDELPVGVGGGP